jgi:hypothetical protein
MPKYKTVEYMYEVTENQMQSLPYYQYQNAYRPIRALPDSAEILLDAIIRPRELVDRQYNSWQSFNFTNLKAFIESGDFRKIYNLSTINEPTQNPISWTIITKIRVII